MALTKIYSVEELLKLEAPKYKFWLEPLIPEQGIVLFYGKYGTYKTPITYAMAMAIASGTPFLDMAVRQGHVLYIEADTPPAVIVDRFKDSILANVTQTPSLDTVFPYPGFNVVNPVTPEELEILQTLRNAHQRHKYDVVFIDSLRCLHNLSDKDSETSVLVYRKLAQLFPQATICLIHHDRKSVLEESPEMHDESFSGSQAWINHATVGIKVYHLDKDKNRVAVKNTKNQASELGPNLTVQIQDGFRVKLGNQVDSVAIKQIIDIMANETEAAKDKAVSKAFGVSERTARRWRLRLED